MKYLALVIVLLSSCSAKTKENDTKLFSQQNNQLVEKIKNNFEKKYNMTEKPTVLKEYAKNKGFNDYTFFEVKELGFKAKKTPDSISSLWFWITIYSYKSYQEANNQFLKLKTYAKIEEEFIFNKGYNFVIAKDNKIYHLNGGCVYSSASWNEIIQSFSKILYKNNDEIVKNMLESPCGY